MLPFDISNHYLLCLLFVVGLVAGIGDAIVGGGGLLHFRLIAISGLSYRNTH